MTNKVELPEDAKVAAKVIDAQSKERGILGNVFGTKEHAPTNIVGLLAILLTIVLFCLMYFPTANGVDRGSIITAVLAAITFSLGLLFGKNAG